jgi:hypothetical protein
MLSIKTTDFELSYLVFDWLLPYEYTGIKPTGVLIRMYYVNILCDIDEME